MPGRDLEVVRATSSAPLQGVKCNASGGACREVSQYDSSDESSGDGDDDEIVEFRQQAEKDERGHGWKLTFIVAFLLLLFVIVGHVVEGWSYITSVYVLMQIVTTIGYGDVTPSTFEMKMFFCVYVLAALMVLATVLSNYVQSMVQRSVQVFEAKLQDVSNSFAATAETHKLNYTPRFKSGKSIRTHNGNHIIGNWWETISATLIMLSMVLIGTLFFWFVERCSCPDVHVAANCTTFAHLEKCLETGGKEKLFFGLLVLGGAHGHHHRLRR
mmetsp:Transcript_147170/g.470309  ORF Transcript_147170/g.470309 Transcript_147170/m.470309 type:complete len:271 (+) Transcript_147170:77-889(+)